MCTQNPRKKMKIEYRPGESHQNAECLSRIPKSLGAIQKLQLEFAWVIATVTFTPQKESQQATGSVHVRTPETKISEWAKLQRTDEYFQMLIKRIGTEVVKRLRARPDFKSTKTSGVK
jgi:hypothetical protein